VFGVVQVTVSNFEEKLNMAEAEAQVKTSSSELVQYRTEDGIAFLTLNDPPANTYSYEMMQSLDRAILTARMDESVQVIVITGNGEKFFSAGANIQMLANVTQLSNTSFACTQMKPCCVLNRRRNSSLQPSTATALAVAWK
jgi:enoyl-CoA hydratase/carnithine racemase